ncbi:MAG: hypothetical protein GX053_12785 [Tissierella sp.]|nr:hypothetical protein [Tissierella sp.]
MKASNIKLQYPEDYKKMEIVLTLDKTQQNIQKIADLKKIIEEGKLLKVDIKQHRKRRSLDANAMLWVILSEMAIILRTTKEELYLEMLGRYGVFTHIIVKPEVVDKVKNEWRTVRELGEITVNGQTGIQLQCYFGSSTYNSKEFSILLDGVVSEAKELGIDVISDKEKQELIEKWGQR